MKFSRSIHVKLAAAVVALAAAGTASIAQARSDVFFSIGANVAPGVSVGVSNAPVYYPPVYAAPVYVQPAPIVVAAPTYYSYGYARPAPVVLAPAPVYFGPRGHWRHERHGHGHGHR